MELICPAGTPAALRSAIDAGADAIYCGFNDETNARNFPGLNFSRDEMRRSIALAHGRGARVLVAINTFPRASAVEIWHRAVDDAVSAGADALILADIGLMDYTARRHPNQRLHVSVQAAAANPDAIAFYAETFGAKRVVLPRVLSVPEIAEITRESACETEVFVFGGLCVMAEGRCSLSSYATGKSPNMQGVCSPPSHVTYEQTAEGTKSSLGGFAINRFAATEPAGYPTLCKGRFSTAQGAGYIFEDPVSLDATTLLKGLRDAGVTALKIEGRQRGRAYVESVVRHFRHALAALESGSEADIASLKPFTEGQASTLGAYRKTWR
ncbi:protease [Bradyrhizobium sp. UNPF46]|uniref:ubiquinone anaerobic biosynthesis protein UbiU n=1 Tax=Bradyrhizobium sp. UNPF46 TaxID=1141168 RepID=UPI00116C617C|nr:peptidase U32 family protein [Bradyrhizobium sp. UNPF46]TQF28023.1 protease [Bradyrhizobium sp. UNPF46]